MPNVRTQHPNASLTPHGRRKMVLLVIDDGWSIEATADKFQVDAKTVRKWRDRYLTEGDAGLFDRSSCPHTSPNQTPPECRRRIIELRKQRRWGADHIAHEVDRAASTVQNILRQEDSAGLTLAIGQPRHRSFAISATGQVNWSMSTSRNSPASPTAAADAFTAEAKHPATKRPAAATSSCTPHSMTAPASSTRRSTQMNKPSQPSGSGFEPTPGSTTSASPSRG